MNDAIEVRPIGYVRSEIHESSIEHIQMPGGNGMKAQIELKPEYTAGLKDMEGLHYIFVVFHFHLTDKIKMLSGPADHADQHGVFATRSPSRPNHIGLSVVKLLKVERNVLFIEGNDMLDGTPVLDIKPFVPDIDAPEQENSGWLKNIDRKAWKSTKKD